MRGGQIFSTSVYPSVQSRFCRYPLADRSWEGVELRRIAGRWIFGTKAQKFKKSSEGRRHGGIKPAKSQGGWPRGWCSRMGSEEIVKRGGKK